MTRSAGNGPTVIQRDKAIITEVDHGWECSAEEPSIIWQRLTTLFCFSTRFGSSCAAPEVATAPTFSNVIAQRD